jgi:hypothetical protein
MTFVKLINTGFRLYIEHKLELHGPPPPSQHNVSEPVERAPKCTKTEPHALTGQKWGRGLNRERPSLISAKFENICRDTLFQVVSQPSPSSW